MYVFTIVSAYDYHLLWYNDGTTCAQSHHKFHISQEHTLEQVMLHQG